MVTLVTLVMSLPIKIFSIIVASVLASFGILYNDISMVLAGSLISPLGSILNDISLGLIHTNIHDIFFNVAALFVIVVIAFIISWKIPKKNEPSLLLYAFIGFLLGIYITYINTLPETPDSIVKQIGVSFGIIILAPIIRIGISLGQDNDNTEEIKKNAKIVVIHALAHIAGAMCIHS